MTQVIDLLRSHRSIRKYAAKPVSPELLEQLFRAGQSAATSSFLQACTVIRVTGREARERIAALAGGQPWVVAAPEFMVFCADLKRAAGCCAKHGRAFQGDFTEHFIIATVDVALMAQSLVTAAESEGLGICYIGGIRNNPQEVSELLALPEGVYPVFGLCLGYPAQDPEVKPRLPLAVVVKDDRYDDTADAAAIAEYDERVMAYYRTRSGGGQARAWSEQAAELLAEKSRPHMRAFLARQGFKMN